MMEGYDDGLAAERASASNLHFLTAGRGGGQARNFYHTSHYEYYGAPAGAEHATFIVGFALSRGNAVTFNNFIQLYGDTNVTRHITLSCTDTGVLEVHRGTTLLGDTAASTIPLTGFHHVELFVTLSDTVGAVKLRVNTTTPSGWTDLTNQDTKNGGTAVVFDTVRIVHGSSSSGDFIIDDLFILNGAGSKNNDLIGDRNVPTLYSDGNGNYSQLVGSDADSTDNYLLVDETGTPSSTDYVGHATAGNKDTYTMDDLTAATGDVAAIMTTLWAAKSDTGAKSIRPAFRRGTTDGVGADSALTTDYLPHDEIFETDPTDASALTITKVNALEVGAEVRA